MFEKKTTKTTKIVLKGLSISNGEIIDIDGTKRDLNKTILAAFEEGDLFDFSVSSKSEDSEVIEE